VKSTNGLTDASKINLKDIPGSSGRLDIIARSINAALWLSHNIRRNNVFHTILHGPPNPNIYIRFEGKNIRRISPDERSIMLFLIKALNKKTGEAEIESTPGVFVSQKDFKQLLCENKDKQIYLLTEKGESLEETIFPEKKDYFFILGDNQDLTDEEKQIAIDAGAKPVSLGKNISYLTSHCITIINWYLDKLESK
jgi:tRNA (pseudouridine54-N1)-methyltransferase